MTDIQEILKLAGPDVVALGSDVVVILDKVGKVLFVNKQVFDWIGFTQDELIGKNIAKAGIMPASSAIKSMINLTARFLGKEIPPYKLDFTAKNGHKLTSTIKARLIKDANGKILADLVLISDIYNKEEYETALAREKEKNDIYIDLVATIIVVIDKNGSVTLLNKKGCELLNTTKEAAVGKNWFDNFIPEEERSSVREVFSKIVSGHTQGVETFQNNVICKTGKRLILWHNRFLEDDDGNIYATLSSGEDVTEKAKQEEVLKKKTVDLEKINNLMVGRELKMMELKKEIQKLKGGDISG